MGNKAAAHRPKRPGQPAWQLTIGQLLEQYDREGWLDDEALGAAGVKLGVSRRTVRQRVGETHRRTAMATRVRLSRAETMEVARERDFQSAVSRLRRAGRSEPTASLEHALWATAGLELKALHHRERARRAAATSASWRALSR